MADIPRLATGVRIVRGGFGDGNQVEGVANVDLSAGDAIIIDTTTGNFVLADASVAGTSKCKGLVASTVKAGYGVTALFNGEMDGFNLAALAYGQDVFLSITAGALADTAPVGAGEQTVKVGTVIKVNDDKVLKVEVRS